MIQISSIAGAYRLATRWLRICRLSSNVKERDDFYRIVRLRNQIYTRTTTQMAANRIQGNPVGADNMLHLAWAQVLRVVGERRDVHWSEAECGPRV